MKEINNVVDTYNMVMGAAIAVATAIFGVYWYIFAAFLLFNVLDWITGWYKARKLVQESSAVGLKGIVKKLGYWVVVAVAFAVPYVFVRMGNDILHIDLSFLTLLGWFTLACLLINEARSIVENLVECGCNVPNILIKGLAVTEKLINAQGKEDKENDERN